MPDKQPTLMTYVIVYASLMALLALTIATSFIDIGRHANNAIAMAIACCKGLLIVLFFMHVRYQPRVIWFFAGAGFLWLGIFLVLSAGEYFGRNHPPGVNPKGEPTFLSQPHVET